MKLDDLVDIEKLSVRLATEGKRVFHQWTDTALDVCSNKYKEIINLRTIYLEIPDSELRPDQIVTFVGELIRLMPTDADKKSLLRAEAFAERKFER